MAQRFHPPDLEQVLRVMHDGPTATNEELIGRIGATHVEGADAEDLAARAVAGLLSREAYGFMQAKLGPSHWRARLSDPKLSTRTMRHVASRLNAVNRRVILLYEQDFGRTRETMHRLGELSRDPRHIVPYFEVLVQSVAQRELPGGTWDLRALAQEVVPLLFDERARLLQFVEEVVARGEPLKPYGGYTNTILGSYDWLRRDPDIDLARIPRDAQANWDLGGGFATPEVSALFGVPFVSLDPTPPSRARELGIGVARQSKQGGRTRRRSASAEEREAHLCHLDEQPWRAFDVFTDALDPSHAKYLITSFGFMSSSVMSLSKGQSKVPVKLRAANTTYCALRAVMELVGRGREVSLLTVHRSTRRAFMNHGVFLRFAGHRLIDHGLAAEPFQGRYSRGVVPLSHKLAAADAP